MSLFHKPRATGARASVVAVALAMASGTLAQPALAADAQAAPAPAQRPAEAPASPPNVLVWMMDDVGYAQVSCFGGLVPTPNIDRVARMGLRYTNYHTAPICSAARAAFLSGRNPHSVNIGGHATAALPQPGYNSHIPPSAGTVADNLRNAGYTTFAIGKWDHLPTEQATPAGPFNQWPSGQGFDRFYGFLAADADNFTPTLLRDHSPVNTPAKKDYHLSEDMADEAIAMIQARRSVDPARPFFMYWATGTAHAPHHAPQEWLERFRGKFDMGWDKAREQILKRQIAQGIMPKGTRLAPRPDVIAAWDDLSAEEKKLYARQMEAFAASLAHADAQFGRILDALEESGELDNTVIVIVSDNGASAEGGLNGLHNEAAVTGGSPPGVAGNMKFYDVWGGPETYPHYANGWALAGDTPLRYWKQVAHEGGARVPFVMAWPKGIAARGELRTGFAHVSDVAPTILQMADAPLAETVNNVKQQPMEGHSFAASFADPKAGDRNRAQYVELYGNRGLWQGDWSIVTTHRIETWAWNTRTTFDEPWELYNLAKDPGQTTDLSEKHPEKVEQMADLFDEQAEKYNVRPQHNMGESAVYMSRLAKEDFVRRQGKWRYTGPVSNIPAQIGPPVNIQGFTMTAKVGLESGDETGPIFALGGQLAGIGLFLKDGRPALFLNGLNGDKEAVEANNALGAGSHELELKIDKAKIAEDRSAEYHVTISAGGKVLADRTFRFKVANYFGLPATFGVGEDEGSPVMKGYAAGNPFPGTISDVVFDFSATGAGAIELQ